MNPSWNLALDKKYFNFEKTTNKKLNISKFIKLKSEEVELRKQFSEKQKLVF